MQESNDAASDKICEAIGQLTDKYVDFLTFDPALAVLGRVTWVISSVRF